MTKRKIQEFQELIFTWFTANQRDLPWRKTHDPYAVLVSEVMLQQTQVDRVKNYWPAWIKRWPTFEALAAAPSADVIRAWAGLGYNRRAVNLKRAAHYIIDHGGFDNFRDPKTLITIPGIGSGTAGALMNFVWNIDTPFLEVNLKRIFQRLAFGPETVVGWRTDNQLLQVARAVLPEGRARIWPHALMDFGALACRPNDPFCANCPLGAILPKSRLDQSPNPTLTAKKIKPKFETTNRYWRGRILAALRVKAKLVAQKLFITLPQPTELTRERFDKLVLALHKEGLLVVEKDSIRLP